MPGPIHGGIMWADQWRPGAGVAGVEQRLEIGDFAEDMVVVGIYLDHGTGAITSTAKLEMAKAGSRNKYSVYSDIFTLSHLFDPDTEGGKFELGVYLPAGEQCVFTVQHTGTDALKWLVVVAPPPVADRKLASMVAALTPSQRE
ncbi:unnamed protein product [marine sediment metagenome]|uniref:Uncharacterized protein n=1 Tax=marine sediment metagenome TaxID=412755 RepID=X0T5Z3_9ZZZZ